MGLTGVGKSTFFSAVTDSENVQSGHMCFFTPHIRVTRCHDPQQLRDVVFVDTPAFDDSTRSGLEILTEIAGFLVKIYRSGVTLSGILYLHRITDNRMTNTLVRSLDMFHNLCGNGALSNVRFVTTHWDQLKDHNQGIRNEGELRKKYLNTFLCGGSEMHRFQYSCSSAWKIINSLPMERKVIRIQREMVDQHKSLWETSPARSLLSWVHRAVEALENFIRQLEELIQKITSADSSENKRRGKDSEHEKCKKELEVARKVLKKLENDKSQFYRQPAIDFNGSSGSFSSSSTSTASSRRYVVHKKTDILERSIRRRPRYTPTLPTYSESSSGESDADVSYDPPGPSPTFGTLPRTIQQLQTIRAAAQVVVPGFEDVVETALRISETLSETPNAHHPLSTLMDSISNLMFAIHDKYTLIKGYSTSITGSFEKINEQLVNIQDVAARLKDCQTESQKSPTLSLDDEYMITECHEAVTFALRELQIN